MFPLIRKFGPRTFKMRHGISVGCAALLLLFGPNTGVFANGRPVGVRLSDIPVKANCEDRSGKTLAFARAKLAGGAEPFVLAARSGERLPLASLKILTLPDQKVDHDGYTEASVVTESGASASYAIKVREGSKNLQLTGYTVDGVALNVDLSRCREVTFSPLGHTVTPRSEVPKK
jgi:hypothetical protein